MTYVRKSYYKVNAKETVPLQIILTALHAAAVLAV